MAKSTSNLSKMSTHEIAAELRRREGSLSRLERQRDRLANKLIEIDEQLARLGGTAKGGRRRPRNDSNLVEALHKALTDTVMSVSEVAVAVQQQGYRTTSPNFRTIVNQALIKDKRFKRVGRGKYTVKA